jgi:hypothetical protein
MRRAKFAINEKLIARLNVDVVALLGRRSVDPAIAKIEPPLVRREGTTL